jgi:hypothetical protein
MEHDFPETNERNAAKLEVTHFDGRDYTEIQSAVTESSQYALLGTGLRGCGGQIGEWPVYDKMVGCGET